jgi:hypothetical protein
MLRRKARGEHEMSTLEEIAAAKERLAERLARLDGERARLAEELNELEIAERVLSRFGRSEAASPRRRRTRAGTASPGPGERGARAPHMAQGLSLSDAALQAVQRHPDGITAGDALRFLSRELGMAVRPNHLAIALHRHRRAGRVDQRDQRWFPLPSPPADASTASA